MSKKWISDLNDGTYQNPIIYADYSDPDVIRVGDDFYMTASSFTYVPGLPILHSKDLVNWRVINYAIKRLPKLYDQPQHGCGVWAPSIRFHDNKFWIYYGDPDTGIFMTSAEDPYGEWSDLVLVKSAIGLIDTCPFWDEDGKAYIVHAYANSRCGIKSKLAVCEMATDGTRIIGDDVIIFDGTISHPTLEGPKFYRINGMYYIMAPAGGVSTGWQSVFRSHHIYGPYEDKIVLRQGQTTINGPHQGGYVELDNKEGWFIHFQDKDAFGRIIHLQPVTWINGWPAMGENIDSGLCGQPVTVFRKPETNAAGAIRSLDDSDNFNSKSLGLQWQWQANPREDYYSLTARPGHLRLNSSGAMEEDAYIWHMPNVLTQLWQAPEMIITVKTKPSKTASHAGLVILGRTYHSISLSGSGSLMIHSGEARKSERAAETVIWKKYIQTDSVLLRADITSDGTYHFSYSVADNEFIPVGDIYTASAGYWVGAKTGLFCVGPKGSYCDFSQFSVNE